MVRRPLRSRNLPVLPAGAQWLQRLLIEAHPLERVRLGFRVEVQQLEQMNPQLERLVIGLEPIPSWEFRLQTPVRLLIAIHRPEQIPLELAVQRPGLELQAQWLEHFEFLPPEQPDFQLQLLERLLIGSNRLELIPQADYRLEVQLERMRMSLLPERHRVFH